MLSYSTVLRSLVSFCQESDPPARLGDLREEKRSAAGLRGEETVTYFIQGVRMSGLVGSSLVGFLSLLVFFAFMAQFYAFGTALEYLTA